jgi:hypothetical protein
MTQNTHIMHETINGNNGSNRNNIGNNNNSMFSPSSSTSSSSSSLMMGASLSSNMMECSPQPPSRTKNLSETVRLKSPSSAPPASASPSSAAHGQLSDSYPQLHSASQNKTEFITPRTPETLRRLTNRFSLGQLDAVADREEEDEDGVTMMLISPIKPHQKRATGSQQQVTNGVFKVPSNMGRALKTNTNANVKSDNKNIAKSDGTNISSTKIPKMPTPISKKKINPQLFAVPEQKPGWNADFSQGERIQKKKEDSRLYLRNQQQQLQQQKKQQQPEQEQQREFDSAADYGSGSGISSLAPTAKFPTSAGSKSPATPRPKKGEKGDLINQLRGRSSLSAMDEVSGFGGLCVLDGKK